MSSNNIVTYAVIDIETVPNEQSHAYYKKKTYEPAANLKDPAKIEQSILEKRQKDMDKAALHWWTGKVICIDADLVGGTGRPISKSFFGNDEKALLIDFFDWLYEAVQFNSNVILIGKSSDFFDTPYLVGRALAHDLGILQCLRPYRPITDIDQIFSFSSQCEQRSSLSNYAFGLGIDGKTGHGSQVSTMYAEAIMGNENQWQAISAYCAQDNNISKIMLKRWLKHYVPKNLPVEKPLNPDIPF